MFFLRYRIFIGILISVLLNSCSYKSDPVVPVTSIERDVYLSGATSEHLLKVQIQVVAVDKCNSGFYDKGIEMTREDYYKESANKGKNFSKVGFRLKIPSVGNFKIIAKKWGVENGFGDCEIDVSYPCQKKCSKKPGITLYNGTREFNGGSNCPENESLGIIDIALLDDDCECCK